MKEMLFSGHLSDVHCVVGRDFGGTKEFHAHKVILAARNPVFHTMFFGSLPENGNKSIDIPDMMPDAFANMLGFLYADADDLENLNVDNIVSTLVCADKYDVPRLTKICSDFIANHLSVNNCLTMLERALEWNADSVVQKCLDLVDAKSDPVLRSDPFTAIRPAALRMILQRSTLTAEENAVYMAAERWAAAACACNDLEASAVNRRQMLGDALFLVRFPLMTPSQLADGPGQSGLLNAAEIASLFMHHNANVKPAALAFPTERRTGLPSVVAPGFQADEAVFARTTAVGKWWTAAKVIRSDGMQVTVQWCLSGSQDTISADNVVRATDILQPGQPLHMFCPEGSKLVSYFMSPANGWHQVIQGVLTPTVPFRCLALLHQQVTQWKAVNGQ
ncbi:BTB/POZ domain-containing protein 3-like [Paramacrobiotus metropolitanus]|uniref:BTB/POZ domain-containing protein 3-like n=1 Tax=Paramacrobiotus metropolitanus TaxID=2943436 RepID=UPI0024458C3B|nr:BTB/POZ domain-containing protein 3-like [Paramacrobiotus metropolitanus]